MSAQTFIDALRAKQGQTASIDPNFHADTLQGFHDSYVGDIFSERVLEGESSDLTQNPTGLGPANAAQINFGPAVGSGADPVSMDSAGTITINESREYRIKVALQFGRTGSSQVSYILFRVLVNGVQAGRSIISKLSNADETQYFENDTEIFLPAGATLQFQIMRDAAGNNSGGLIGFDPAVAGGAEWNTAPSAAIRVSRKMVA
tara:strand:- start:11142 stop:11753 length:612 start_codon:yes stop_codon:yes gene_type:complete